MDEFETLLSNIVKLIMEYEDKKGKIIGCEVIRGDDTTGTKFFVFDGEKFSETKPDVYEPH